MRQIVETESARLAAHYRTPEQLAEFHAMFCHEEAAFNNDPQSLTDIDFLFHLSVAISSRNLVYPLIINSFKGVYTSLTGKFYRKYRGTPVVLTVFQFHGKLVDAFDHLDEENASSIMTEMLRHGEIFLKGES